ncbi:MAG: NAD-dependent epimerase [bacterium]|nr:NAD-dependent epimerase [bacterium]
MKILITGTAGFIGYHLAKRLFESGDEIVGLDNINDYYDVNLKYGRLQDSGINTANIQYDKILQSSKHPNYRFIKLNLEDRDAVPRLFRQEKFDRVCHLAAQAGVRYSLGNPNAYLDSNLAGTLNILEGCRYNKVGHLVYAGSSSVYGLNETMPYSTHHNVDHPVSLYAATKKSTELMAHTYSHLYGIPTTGLRFFTVYGPWGRPDMAYFKFTKNILENKSIDIYNHGKMQRDFTYIDDIIEGITRIIAKPAQPNDQWTGKLPDPASGKAPYKIYNIGNNSPVELMDFIETIEKKLGKKAEKNMMPMQPGDVYTTWADCADLEKDFDYKPGTTIKEGIRRFIQWYLKFYKITLGK